MVKLRETGVDHFSHFIMDNNQSLSPVLTNLSQAVQGLLSREVQLPLVQGPLVSPDPDLILSHETFSRHCYPE